MSLREWLFGRSATPEPLAMQAQERTYMNFAEFTRTYKGKVKSDGTPYVFPSDTALVSAQTGLGHEDITNWVSAWNEIQTAYVRNANRMPTVEEIIREWNLAHGVVEPAPTPVPTPTPTPVPTGRRFVGPFTSYVPAPIPPEQRRMGDLTVAEFEELMMHIMGQLSPTQDDAAAAMRARLEAALKALQ